MRTTTPFRIASFRGMGGSGGGSSSHPSFVFDAIGNGSIAQGGTPTFTNATIRTITDQDLVVRQVLSGEVRFGGFRRVQNIVPTPENISAGGGWTISNSTVTSGATAPDGTATAFTLTATAASGQFFRSQASTSTGLLNSVWIRRRTGTGQITIVKPDAGTADDVTASVTTSWKRFSGSITGAQAGTNGFIGVLCAINGDAVDVWHPQQESVVGQSNQNPAEYVSVGVLSAPYQGANVDGVQYFPYLNGNTVASNVVTEVRGAAISSSILGGYLPEPAATDLLTARADARDMTTANWTLGATMTRARTSVGADGVANKATRLTGGAVAATNTILTTITAAASSRTYSVLIKRVTGTGAVSICQDGTTFTDISSLINSSTYTLVQLNANQLNAQLGIKISVLNDAIDADWNQFSAGDLTGLINSRIPDTITTRNADVLTYATTGWLNAAAGTLYAEWFQPSVAGTYLIASLDDSTLNNRIQNYSGGGTSANTIVQVASVTQASLANASLTSLAVAKSIQMWQLNDFAGFANNVTMGTDAAGTIPTVTQLDIGHQTGITQLGHYVRKIAYYPARLPNAVAQSLTV